MLNKIKDQRINPLHIYGWNDYAMMYERVSNEVQLCNFYHKALNKVDKKARKNKYTELEKHIYAMIDFSTGISSMSIKPFLNELGIALNSEKGIL